MSLILLITMAIVTFYPTTVKEIIPFVNDKVNDIFQMWINKNNTYLGSLLPKMRPVNMSCDGEQELIMTLYKKNEADQLCEVNIVILETEMTKYSFLFL